MFLKGLSHLINFTPNTLAALLALFNLHNHHVFLADGLHLKLFVFFATFIDKISFVLLSYLVEVHKQVMFFYKRSVFEEIAARGVSAVENVVLLKL